MNNKQDYIETESLYKIESLDHHNDYTSKLNTLESFSNENDYMESISDFTSKTNQMDQKIITLDAKSKLNDVSYPSIDSNNKIETRCFFKKKEKIKTKSNFNTFAKDKISYADRLQNQIHCISVKNTEDFSRVHKTLLNERYLDEVKSVISKFFKIMQDKFLTSFEGQQNYRNLQKIYNKAQEENRELLKINTELKDSVFNYRLRIEKMRLEMEYFNKNMDIKIKEGINDLAPPIKNLIEQQKIKLQNFVNVYKSKIKIQASEYEAKLSKQKNIFEGEILKRDARIKSLMDQCKIFKNTTRDINKMLTRGINKAFTNKILTKDIEKVLSKKISEISIPFRKMINQPIVKQVPIVHPFHEKTFLDLGNKVGMVYEIIKNMETSNKIKTDMLKFKKKRKKKLKKKLKITTSKLIPPNKPREFESGDDKFEHDFGTNEIYETDSNTPERIIKEYSSDEKKEDDILRMFEVSKKIGGLNL